MSAPLPSERQPPLLATDDGDALPLLAVVPGALDDVLDGLDAGAAAFLRAGGFTAAAGQVALIPGPAGLAGAVLGLGEEGGASPWTFGELSRRLPPGTTWRLRGAPDRRVAVLGWCLGDYRFDGFRAPVPEGAGRAGLVAEPGDEAATGMAAAIHWARDLINTPAGALGPAELIAALGALAASHDGAAVEVVQGEALAENYPAVATVGAGSHRAPRVGILRWNGGGADAPLVALCGKGVCFDTGGLDLKPSAAMLRMKKDMGGAAVVMALAAAIMRARLPVRLMVLVGAVENAVSERAFRPMDVLRTRAGITVEVGNTDAEGRLVLADLLTRACEEDPALLINCATLTGAARVALGPDLPALFTDDDDLARVLHEAGARERDPVWRLPLARDYVSWLDSAVADMNNVAAKPMAGAIVAALFLRRFVPQTVRWAHLDLYGWNDSHRPGRPEGGEAQTVRALFTGIEAIFHPDRTSNG